MLYEDGNYFSAPRQGCSTDDDKGIATAVMCSNSRAGLQDHHKCHSIEYRQTWDLESSEEYEGSRRRVLWLAAAANVGAATAIFMGGYLSSRSHLQVAASARL